MKTAKLWLLNSLIAFDELCNCFFLGGAPSDTISGRAERGRTDGKRIWSWLANVLDWLQPNHSANALKNDIAGRHNEALDIE
jgi:hypothetical protein